MIKWLESSAKNQMRNYLLEKEQEAEAIFQLNAIIKSNSDPRELKRAFVVKMSYEKESPKKIAKVLGVREEYVRKWMRKFKEEGIEGIRLKYQGSKGNLTQEQKAEVQEWLRARKRWDLDELVTYIVEKYQVMYKSKQSYYSLLAEAKITWKKSQKVNPRKNEELVKKNVKKFKNL
jgi:putative transposase